VLWPQSSAKDGRTGRSRPCSIGSVYSMAGPVSVIDSHWNFTVD